MHYNIFDYNVPMLWGSEMRDIRQGQELPFCHDTEIFKYVQNHPENSELSKILDETIDETYYCCGPEKIIFFLHRVYGKIIDQNMTDIIDSICQNNYNQDEIIICILSITKERYDILEILSNKGFDFNHKYVMTGDEYSFLKHAISRSWILIEYLISRGLRLDIDNYYWINNYIFNMQDEIFEYVMTLDIPISALADMLTRFCTYTACIKDMSNDTRDKIMYRCQKILEKGINFDLIDFSGVDMSPEILHCMIEYGFEPDSDLLKIACERRNSKLIDYLLEYGVTPTKEILETVLEIFNEDTIKIFLKHKIVWSIIMNGPNDDKCETLITQLEENGLSPMILLKFLIGKFTGVPYFLRKNVGMTEHAEKIEN